MGVLSGKAMAYSIYCRRNGREARQGRSATCMTVIGVRSRQIDSGLVTTLALEVADPARKKDGI